MFRQFAGTTEAGADQLFRMHPLDLASLLEQAWNLGIADSGKQGRFRNRSGLKGLPDDGIKSLQFTRSSPSPDRNPAASSESEKPPVIWNHLIYAFMIENTGVYEVFRQVLHAFLHGEDLGAPLEDADHWLRNTEALFYQDSPPFFIHSLTSTVRPSLCSSRRGAYYRMFGMELSHPQGALPAFTKAKAANTKFRFTFEEFLREVWVGINESQVLDDRQTNDPKIAFLAKKLHDMLLERRNGGNLAREEFFFVSMMSWFHLTLEHDSPIVRSLDAKGDSPGKRLQKIAERVGADAHTLAKNFFDIADAVSRILLQIETGTYNEPAAAPALYTPVAGGGPEQDIRTIVTHWSITHLHALKFDNVSPN